jgi:hypothetical protein
MESEASDTRCVQGNPMNGYSEKLDKIAESVSLDASPSLRFGA